jgi:hypothetical protein
MAFFVWRRHLYDSDQGVNLYLWGEGEKEKEERNSCKKWRIAIYQPSLYIPRDG